MNIGEHTLSYMYYVLRTGRTVFTVQLYLLLNTISKFSSIKQILYENSVLWFNGGYFYNQ